jgi:hypothetical protein
MLDYVFVTPTYRNDFPLVVDLCQSVDQYARGDFAHLLIVPDSDRRLFLPLQSARRQVMTKEEVLQGTGLRRLPFPARIRIPGIVDRRLNEQWLFRGRRRLGGWLVQQIIKLSAASYADSEVIIMLDSDLAMIRPFSLDHVHVDGKTLLYEHTLGSHLAPQQRWFRIAHEILGLQPGEYVNHIGPFICWRRHNLKRLYRRIESVSGMEWVAAICGRNELAEYMLYGTYCRKVDPENCGHFFADTMMCRPIWSDKNLTVERISPLISEKTVAVCFQSYLPIDRERRRTLIRDIQTKVMEPAM